MTKYFNFILANRVMPWTTAAQDYMEEQGLFPPPLPWYFYDFTAVMSISLQDREPSIADALHMQATNV